MGWLDAITGLAEVKEYEGELENDGEWIPALPAALVEMTGKRPAAETSDGKIVRYSYGLRVYVAGEYGQTSGDVLDMVDAVLDKMEDLTLNYSGECHDANLVEMRLEAKDKAIKIYAIDYIVK